MSKRNRIKRKLDISEARKEKIKHFEDWGFDYSQLNEEMIDVFGSPIAYVDEKKLQSYLENNNMTVSLIGGNHNVVIFYNQGTYYEWLAMYERYVFSSEDDFKESKYKVSLWYKNSFEDMLRLVINHAYQSGLDIVNDILVGVKIKEIEDKVNPILEKYASGEYKWLNKDFDIEKYMKNM